MLEKWFTGLKNFNLTTKIEEQLQNYRIMIVEQNKITNLTRITDKVEIYYKHFYDALLFTNEINLKNENICDVGSGMGVPGIVLKICFPDINLTIIEANKKKCQFLDNVVKKLSLENVFIINDRAESFAHQYRESYDIVVARALAPLSICNELCAPLIKINGLFIAFKGLNAEKELDVAKNSVNLLGLKLLKINNYQLPQNMGTRKIIIMKKIKLCPLKFPRTFQQIKNKPL